MHVDNFYAIGYYTACRIEMVRPKRETSEDLQRIARLHALILKINLYHKNSCNDTH
jgi:hypothetical protein